MFWRYGYEGVSVDELTTAMGITTQKFYTAFGSKERLHREALAWYEREAMRPVRAALEQEPDVRDAVVAALEASAGEFTRGDRPPGCMRSMAGVCVSISNRSVAEHGSALRRETVAAIEARLVRGVADGQLGEDINISGLAMYLNATIVGMSVAAQDGATTNDLLAIAGIAAAAIPPRQRR